MGFAVPMNHKEKMKESEKIDTYLVLVRELKKKGWKLKVTMILNVVGAFGKVPKSLEKRLEELVIRGRIPDNSTDIIVKISKNTE